MSGISRLGSGLLQGAARGKKCGLQESTASQAAELHAHRPRFPRVHDLRNRAGALVGLAQLPTGSPSTAGCVPKARADLPT